VVDPWVALAGLLVGFVVGLTGMGGGALMTPLLVLLFGVQPLAAVSSDLVASMVMKPVGSAVHLREGTVQPGLVRWLVIGSVPAAFLGVLLLKLAGGADAIQHLVKTALGVALLVVSCALVAKPFLTRSAGEAVPGELAVRKLPTLLVGVIGGLVVGMTSVGSGSLIILMLLALYPRLQLKELVGTDLVQAVPLVAAASLAHILFGDFQLALTASILIGALPGVYVGARLSSRAPDHWIRPALIVVLLASGLKLLGMSNAALGYVSVALVAIGVTAAVTGIRRSSAAAARAASSESMVTGG
jgi:uncharacterized protein